MQLLPKNHGTEVKDSNIPNLELSLSKLDDHRAAVTVNNKIVAYIGFDVAASDNNPQGKYNGSYIYFVENPHEIKYKSDANCFQLNE